MGNDDVRRTERVRDHLRRILNQHTTPAAGEVVDTVPDPGSPEVPVEVQVEENDPGDATRACCQAAIPMCTRPHSASDRSSMTIFDPKTGQTVTIEPKPRTRR
jgi:hypothetical protein